MKRDWESMGMLTKLSEHKEKVLGNENGTLRESGKYLSLSFFSYPY